MTAISDHAEIDDILALSGRKKGVNSGSKGKRKERELCKMLTARFSDLLGKNPSWGLFSRSVGSGNRWGQKVVLSQEATCTFSGDISVPTGFRFVLESKGGYNDVDLVTAFGGGHPTIDGFLKQVSDDAERSGRRPMLIWRKDRRPGLVFMKTGEAPPGFVPEYCMKYRDWTVYRLEDVLSLPDEFFFDISRTDPAPRPSAG